MERRDSVSVPGAAEPLYADAADAADPTTYTGFTENISGELL